MYNSLGDMKIKKSHVIPDSVLLALIDDKDPMGSQGN